MSRDDEVRAAIAAAADRLLAGTPLRSTGQLTVVQLAAKACVKRWLLTHKHRDLGEQFQARVRAIGGDPPPVRDLKARIGMLEADIGQRRKDLAEQRVLVEYYAHLINELATELDRVTAERDHLLGNVRRITDAPSLRGHTS